MFSASSLDLMLETIDKKTKKKKKKKKPQFLRPAFGAFECFQLFSNSFGLPFFLVVMIIIVITIVIVVIFVLILVLALVVLVPVLLFLVLIHVVALWLVALAQDLVILLASP